MSFALDLKAFAQKTTTKADMVVRKVVIDVGTSLVFKSPVGDADYWINKPPAGYVGGRFRANWQYGLNSPSSVTHDKTDSNGAATVSAIVGKVSKQAAGKVHYLTNGLPYGKRLEEGWSHRQAPNGMVGLTVIEFQQIVVAAAAEVQ